MTELSPPLDEREVLADILAFVLERDEYQCRACGRAGDNVLHVHHWKYRSHGGSNDPRNLITLCLWCHESLHRDPTIMAIVVDATGYPHVFVRRRP